jgi:YidC/Oxa1 family membrane protein insertase
LNEQRNVILAIVLSAIVLFGWSALSEKFFPTAAPPSTKIEAGKEIVVPKPGADPAADSVPAVRAREAVLADTPRVAIRTPNLVGSLNLKGARIDDLVLANPLYTETLAPGSPAIRLLSPSGAPGAYFTSVGWSGAGAPPSDALWTASAATLTPQAPVTLSWSNPQGARFEILLAVDDQFMFTATQRVVNATAAPVALRPFALVSRVGESKDPDTWTAHVGPLGVFDDILDDVNWEDIRDDGNQAVDFTSRGGWLGFSDKYWLTAIVPDQKAKIDATMRHAPGDRYQLDFAAEAFAAEPGQTVTTTARLFAGAKEVEVLDGYKDSLGIPQFDKAIDWGWFYFLTKPIFYLLDWLFEMVGNFGVAIIGLTIIVRTLMFPIANKQYASMAKMRVLTPKMKALQERFKDDKLKLQQEMMELYKREKVNPLAGCLPILLQIPVFYALYKVLMVTVEMRHQPFALWIKDLSAPDPLTPLNLFGLLPFTPPAVIALGVLPILLGITMWLQQKLNPQPMDEIQAKVFAWMPWIFMVIMAPFAAGLQLYWVTNNILSIAQQWYMVRKYPVPTPEPAKS